MSVVVVVVVAEVVVVVRIVIVVGSVGHVVVGTVPGRNLGHVVARASGAGHERLRNHIFGEDRLKPASQKKRNRTVR
jgi:hypothetical protein